MILYKAEVTSGEIVRSDWLRLLLHNRPVRNTGCQKKKNSEKMFLRKRFKLRLKLFEILI